jgi:hypothetical protein
LLLCPKDFPDLRPRQAYTSIALLDPCAEQGDLDPTARVMKRHEPVMGDHIMHQG